MGAATIELDRRGAIFSVKCIERGVEVTRYVKPTVMTLEHLKFIWSKVKNFDILFQDQTRGDFDAFVDNFLVNIDGELSAAGLMWDVDDVGMFFLNDLVPGVSASAHFVFWDRIFSGREELCQEMLIYIMHKYGFQRIEVKVPVYATKAMAATEQIGFVKEGRLRKATLYKGEWFDVNVYSVVSGDLNFQDVFDKDLSKWDNRRFVCHNCGKVQSGEEVK